MHLFFISAVLEIVRFCEPLHPKPFFILFSLRVAMKIDDKFERSGGDLGSLFITMWCLNNPNISVGRIYVYMRSKFYFCIDENAFWTMYKLPC